MLDFARTTLDIVAPAGDLLYANAYEILMDNVTSGFVVGKSVIEGVRCDHLAFRGANVDWQIWIREGSKPLPCKLVIPWKECRECAAVLGGHAELESGAEVHCGKFQFQGSARSTTGRILAA